MKILLTGLTGFIGSELAHRLLEEGHEVHGFVQHVVGRDLSMIEDIKDKINIVTCDIRNYFSVRHSIKKVNPDVVFHLAALSPVRLSFEMPYDFQETTYLGTVNMAEAIRDLYGPEKVRFIVASTAEVFGIQDEEKPFTEDLRLEPSSPYAVAKASMDMYIRMLIRVYNFNAVILRNSNTFGRKYDPSFFTEYIITEMLKGNEIYIGAENSVRSYMYLTDHVNSYLLAMKPEARGEVFNISGEKGYSNKEWVLKIAKLLNFSEEKIHFGKYPKKYPDRPISSDQPYLVLDSTKAQKILGWKQTVSPEDGLKKIIEYWKNEKI